MATQSASFPAGRSCFACYQQCRGLSSSKKASKVEEGGAAYMDDVACLLQAPLPDALLKKLA